MYAHGRAVHSRAVGVVRPGASRHALAWLLLLCAVLLGIVAMHTLGHPADHARGTLSMSAGHGTAGHVAEPMDRPAHKPFPGVSSAAAGRVVSHMAGADTGMLVDPSDICLAVLIAAGALIALRRMTVRIRAAQRNGTRAARPFSRPLLRAPPGLGPPLLGMVVLRI
ncbi:hypothetical protein [Actinomadura formosensis]|uniref:hypothetical protein n=1 Tax=Actinomadura formosensis TaxID=60706 RepID=UPI003D94695A